MRLHTSRNHRPAILDHHLLLQLAHFKSQSSLLSALPSFFSPRFLSTPASPPVHNRTSLFTRYTYKLVSASTAGQCFSSTAVIISNKYLIRTEVEHLPVPNSSRLGCTAYRTPDSAANPPSYLLRSSRYSSKDGNLIFSIVLALVVSQVFAIAPVTQHGGVRLQPHH